MKMPSHVSGSFTPGRTSFPSFEEAAHAYQADAEWRAFQAVLSESLECVIDHAIVCVVDEAEDVRALEHLRSLTRAHFAGIAMPIRMHDFLHALGILLAGFQVEPRNGRWGCEESDLHSIAVASERLRHVVQEAATATRGEERSNARRIDPDVGATEHQPPPPKRRSTPRRTKPVSPTA
jgi:hypothetical protein